MGLVCSHTLYVVIPLIFQVFPLSPVCIVCTVYITCMLNLCSVNEVGLKNLIQSHCDFSCSTRIKCRYITLQNVLVFTFRHLWFTVFYYLGQTLPPKISRNGSIWESKRPEKGQWDKFESQNHYVPQLFFFLFTFVPLRRPIWFFLHHKFNFKQWFKMKYRTYTQWSLQTQCVQTKEGWVPTYTKS